MALIHYAGFDGCAALADLVTGPFDSISYSNGAASSYTIVPNVTNARMGAGKCVSFTGYTTAATGTTNAAWLVKGYGEAVASAVVGCAFLLGTNVPSSGTFSAVLGFANGTPASPQLSLAISNAGVLTLYRGAPNSGTVLATYSPSGLVVTGYNYVELSATINPTVGAVTVRLNGTAIGTLTLTGVNTSNDGTSTLTQAIAGISVNNYQSSNDTGFLLATLDDFVMLDTAGSAPYNTFLGDVHVVTGFPNSNNSVTWTNTASATTVSTGSATGSNYSFSANTVWYGRLTATSSGFLTSTTCDLAGGFTGHLNMAVYADNSGTPGALLQSGTAITNPATGINTVTFAGTQMITSGTVYWVALTTDTGCNFVQNGSTSGQAGGYQTSSYASGFPANAAISVGTGWIYQAMTVTLGGSTSSNYLEVNDASMDGDGTYNTSTVNGAIDTFNWAGFSTVPATVYAVQVKVAARQALAGPGAIAGELVSGATTVVGSTQVISPSYSYFDSFWINDPNTTAAWMPTAVNAVKFGYNRIY